MFNLFVTFYFIMKNIKTKKQNNEKCPYGFCVCKKKIKTYYDQLWKIYQFEKETQVTLCFVVIKVSCIISAHNHWI